VIKELGKNTEKRSGTGNRTEDPLDRTKGEGGKISTHTKGKGVPGLNGLSPGEKVLFSSTRALVEGASGAKS